MRGFGDYNPAAVSAVLGCILLLCMFRLDPLLLALALLGAAAYESVRGEQSWRRWSGQLAVILLSGAVNPLFQHRGESILLVVNDAPVTAEAVFYGLAAGAMISAVLWWSRIFSRLMTEERLLYLFGMLSPRLALLLSMTLRYIPLCRRKAGEIHEGQVTLGRREAKTIPGALRGRLREFSILATWALENGVVTADSMSARGYGTGRRSRFARFLFTRRDGELLAAALLLSGAALLLWKMAGEYAWYPRFRSPEAGWAGAAAYVCWALLCLLPAGVEWKEGRRWKSLQSGI